MPPDAARVLAARALRAFGDGAISLLLPVYLTALGFDAFHVGIIATATLLGSAAVTLLIGVVAHRFTRRGTLLAASVLMTATGLAFAFVTDFWPLVLIAFVGTLNPSSGDVSLFLPLEQALLSHTAADRDRTRVFAWYSLTGSLVGALGSLFAGVPKLLIARYGLGLLPILDAMFILYALFGVASFALYRRLTPVAEGEGEKPAAPLGPSKRIVYTIAALFSLDAFGGGLVVQTLLALWLFKRYSLPLDTAAVIFFWMGVLSSISFLIAVPISRRIGLINTMVFTHLPSNVCLMLVPLMPNLGLAVALLFARSALSQMDVPTRTSYVMAVVTPGERAAEASVTAVPRSLAAAMSPVLAGALLTLTSFGWPLVIAGALKAAYDLLLLAMFRNVRPPEEDARRP
jgi:MFS family permease